jgi:hypothetical protein
MKSFAKLFVAALVGTVISGTAAMAQTVNVDYDHTINFLKYKSYTLQKVHATDPSVEGALTIALDRDLTARYLHADADKGEIIVAIVDATQDKAEYGTFYDGLNGLAWQRGWGSGGFMDAAATPQDLAVGSVILDMWDRKTQKLIWRGTLTETLAGSEDKKDNTADKSVGKLLNQFPPKFKK